MIGPGPSLLRSSRRRAAPSSPLDVITSSNGAWWVTAERGKNIVSDSTLSSPSTTRASYTSGTLVEDTSVNTSHFLTLDGAFVATGVAYTVSIEAKAAGRSWFCFQHQATGWSPIAEAYFDVTNGVTGTRDAAITSSSITALGDGWYRCVATRTATGDDAAMSILVVLAEADNDFNYTGDGSSGIQFRNPQVEEGSSFTSYEETTGTATYGALLDQTGGGRHLLLPGGSANPVLLDHSGTDYFWLPGTDNNCLVVAEDPAHDVTTGLEIEWYGEVTANGVVQTFAQNSHGGGDYLFLFRIEANNFMTLRLRNSTPTTLTATCSVALTSTVQGCKVTWRASDGRVQFFTYNGTSWSQLGTDRNIAHASLKTGTGDLFVGGGYAKTGCFAGTLSRFVLRDAPDGTIVADVNASDADPDATTFTEASSNAATVTINRSSTGYCTEVVDQPKYIGAIDDYLQTSGNGAFFAVDTDDFTMIWVGALRQPMTSGFDTLMATASSTGDGIGIRRLAAAGGYNARVFYQGASDAAFKDLVTTFGTHSIAVSLDRTAGELESYLDGVASGAPDDASGVGTQVEEGELIVFATVGPDHYSDTVFIGAAFIKQALTATEISDIADALITANGGTP